VDLPEQVTCGYCSYPARLDKVNQAYICTVCGSELWTDERKLKEYQQKVSKEDPVEARRRQLSHINRQLTTEVLPIYPVPSGGGGSKSCGRKKPKKKPKIEKWEG